MTLNRSCSVFATCLSIASTLSGVNGFSGAANVNGGGVGVTTTPRTFALPTRWSSSALRQSTLDSMDTTPSDAKDSVQSSPREAARPNPLPPRSELVGVIFDMDGTITKHCIDFADLRRRIYDIADDDCNGADNHDGGCVLELAETLSPEGRKRARDVFEEIEQKAIDDMTFTDGLVDLCRFLDENGLKRAILTRNVRRSVDAMHDLLLDSEGVSGFYPALARDSTCERGEPIPSKPAPDAILRICSVWGCDPSSVLMVGDSAADDIVAGARAGCGARVLLAEGGRTRDTDSGNGGPIDEEEARQRTPCITVESLLELRDLLRCNQ